MLIAGESLAGTTAARHLRTLGHTGPVTVIGAEEHGAYSRPPLSKAVLKDPAVDQTLGLVLDSSTGWTSKPSARPPSGPTSGTAS